VVHIVAAKAVALGEALRPEFRAYAAQIVANAKVLAAALQQAGYRPSPAEQIITASGGRL